MNPEQEKCYELVVAAFELIKNKLPEQDVSEASDFIFKHKEWGIGMEHIMFTLSECQIGINQSEYESIETACKSMGICVVSSLEPK